MLSNDDPAIAARNTSILRPLTPHATRAARACAICVAATKKRNNMFSNWIYRGMPTIVLLIIAGIIEFMAVRAFA